ncbi:MAG TPA: DHA2 family efflux MFS transporter permease subunit [Pseudonocardia sp.]|nr:DHA2 family efflux MFS transporter permease subunit [Pseudonocardia sp.]
MGGTQASEESRIAAALTDPEPAPVSWLLPLAVVVVGMFMAVLDATIVNVALPRIQGDLGADTEDVLWVATAYTLTLGVVVPLSGWLADRFGLKRVYLTTLIAFSAGSALCGVAWDLNSLIGFRILQAVPGGLLPVISLTILNVMVPPEKIGAAMGLYGLGIVCAPAVGPVLGGWLVDNFHWSLIFYINVPIGLAGAVAAYFILGNVGTRVRRPFDVIGFACIGSSLFSLLLACSKGEDWGWTSYPTLALFTYGVLAMALFVVVELEVTHPLLDVRVFRCWSFSVCMVLLVVVTVGLLGALYYLPVFMQLGQGLTALESGMRILPSACVMAVFMPLAGRIYDKLGPRWLAAVGFTICAVGNYLMHDLTADVTHSAIVWWTIVRAIGMGCCTMPVMTTGIASVGAARVNAGSAWTMVVRQTSGAIPLAIMSAIATGQQSQLMSDRAAVLTPAKMAANGVRLPSADPTSIYGVAGVFRQTQVQVLASSYADVFLITAGLSAVAALLALTLPGRPPARVAAAKAAESAPTAPSTTTEPPAEPPAVQPPGAAEPALEAVPELPVPQPAGSR